MCWRVTKLTTSTNEIIFAGGLLGDPPAQIASALAGGGQVGPYCFVLAGANYTRQHGKRAVPAQIISGLVIDNCFFLLD